MQHLIVIYILALPSVLVIAALVASFVNGDAFLRRQVLIAFDQLGNALLRGWADETISARAWRKRLKHSGWRRVQVAIDWVFEHAFSDPDHCEKSYASERLRLQSPPEVREGGVL